MEDTFSIMNEYDYLYSNTPNKYNDFIFIGNEKCSLNLKHLEEIGITHIIRIGVSLKDNFTEKFVYLSIAENDTSNDNLYRYFIPVYEFIESAIKINGKILIHCVLGKSRSVTLLCSYIIMKDKIPYYEAIKKIQKIRPIADPNNGFIFQLREFYLKNVANLIKITKKYKNINYSCHKFNRKNTRKFSHIKYKSKDKKENYNVKINNSKISRKILSFEYKKIMIYTFLEEKFMLFMHLDTYALRKKLMEYIKLPRLFIHKVLKTNTKDNKINEKTSINNDVSLVKRFGKKVVENLISNH